MTPHTAWPFSALTALVAPLVASLLAIGLTLPAHAASVTVQVMKADGSPAGDAVVQLLPVGAWNPPDIGAPVVMTQKDMRFEPYVVAVPLGGTLRLSNQDRYDHHVRAMAGGPLGNTPPAKTFEVRLPGFKSGTASSADVKLDGSAGGITLGCHIHGSMRGHVFVSSTPWVAVTDERGEVVLNGLPEGAADLKVWHPDQLLEQTSQRLNLGAAPQASSAKLNFSPRKRRSPPPVDHYAQ